MPLSSAFCRCTSDVHYVRKEDAEAHDILLCMQVKKKVQDENRFRFSCDDFYLKNESEVYSELVSMGLEPSLVESAIRNTHRIADKCNALIKTDMHLLPEYGENENYQLALHCNEGYKKRYGSYNKEIVERVQYELDVIRQKGYAGYFLIVEDFINYAKKNNILVGPVVVVLLVVSLLICLGLLMSILSNMDYFLRDFLILKGVVLQTLILISIMSIVIESLLTLKKNTDMTE